MHIKLCKITSEQVVLNYFVELLLGMYLRDFWLFLTRCFDKNLSNLPLFVSSAYLVSRLSIFIEAVDTD